MPKRMHPIPGTKERPIGRRCLTFRFAGYGPVIIDRVRPEHREELFSRLWGHYGYGSIWVEYRRLKPGETYTELDVDQAAS